MQIIRGKQPGAKKTVVYGPEGIGKSTLVSKFPDAIFIDTEGSTKVMDVARTQAPSSWTMLMEQVRYLINNRVCKTIIIDTADWAEILCTNHVCDKNHKESIEAFGYGKGYIYVQEEFGRLLNLLEDATKQGINVVFTAHAKMRKFEQPDEMGAYDRWEMKLSKNVAPLVKEWAETREAWLIMLEETQISAIESLLIRVETLLRLQEKEDVLVELADLSMTIGEIPIKEKAYWNHIL